MADQKLSELTELAATPANDDEVYIRDVSEAAAQESKRITIANLMAGAAGKSIATGSYVGDNTDDRQITVGFKCSLVIVWDASGFWFTTSASRACMLRGAGGNGVATDVLLHATNGFVVDQAQANYDATTYYYWAISE